MTKNNLFIARYAIRKDIAWASYASENEMYADLEVQGVTEDNPDVHGINYYELQENEDGSLTKVREWDFGKPWVEDYWKTLTQK